MVRNKSLHLDSRWSSLVSTAPPFPAPSGTAFTSRDRGCAHQDQHQLDCQCLGWLLHWHTAAAVPKVVEVWGLAERPHLGSWRSLPPARAVVLVHLDLAAWAVALPGSNNATIRHWPEKCWAQQTCGAKPCPALGPSLYLSQRHPVQVRMQDEDAHRHGQRCQSRGSRAHEYRLASCCRFCWQMLPGN